MDSPISQASDFERDRWGRPLIVPVDGGKPVPYIRASSAAKTIEDTWNLEMYARRNVAYGMARDASLVARVLAVGSDPSNWTREDRDAVNKIHEDAQKVAQAHRAADIGTAVHALTDQTDRGLDVHAGPYQADLAAYQEAMREAGFELRPAWIECRLVCDELQIAGTADRIVTRGGDHLIVDIKTGHSVDFGGLGWAAQLGCYANSLLYDVARRHRTPTPNINRRTGIICHLPAGRGECTLYEIDIAEGYRAARMANEIRAIRRESKTWIRPLTTPPTAPPAPSRSDIVAELGANPDEGADVPTADFDQLETIYHACDEDARIWFAGITRQSAQAAVDFRAQTRKTLRRWELYRGLLTLCKTGAQCDEIARALASAVTGSDAHLAPCVTTGHAVGALDAGQAAQFATLAVDYVEGGLRPTVHEDGTLRFTPA
jgi:hypothetical protein